MKHYSIEQVLDSRSLAAYLGIEDMNIKYRSPLPGRSDSDPSFHVFKGSNGRLLWKDFGMVGKGSCGNLVSLHRLLTGCDADTACTELMNWDGASAKCHVYNKTAKSGKISHVSGEKKKDTKAGVRTKTPVMQSRYIRHTGLPVPTWVIDQLELFVDLNGNLCFPTSNGTHIKGGLLSDSSKTFAGNLGSGGFSICGIDNGNWMVLEGIGDFLALIDMLPEITGKGTFLILNSTNTIPQAIKWLHTQRVDAISLLLDVDQAGNNETARFIREFPTVVDQRAIITSGKDVKDTWVEWKKN